LKTKRRKGHGADGAESGREGKPGMARIADAAAPGWIAMPPNGRGTAV
jgi:hypothetical protein